MYVIRHYNHLTDHALPGVLEMAVDATPVRSLPPGRIETMTSGARTLREIRSVRSDRRDVLADAFRTWEAI